MDIDVDMDMCFQKSIYCFLLTQISAIKQLLPVHVFKGRDKQFETPGLFGSDSRTSYSTHVYDVTNH